MQKVVSLTDLLMIQRLISLLHLLMDIILKKFFHLIILFSHAGVKIEGGRSPIFRSSGRDHVNTEEGVTAECHSCDVSFDSH